MAFYYRYTDAITHPDQVKDTMLSSSYGDLAPGDDSAIRINAGIVDSNIGLFSFPVAKPYSFGAEGEIVGFDFRYKTVAEDAAGGINTVQGDKGFGLYDIYLMKKGSEIIGDEGDVKLLSEHSAHTMSSRIINGNSNSEFFPMDLACFLTTMDYTFPPYPGFSEAFEGQSDVDVELETSHGAVRKKGDPYLGLDLAHKSMPRQAAGPRLAKNELSLFYGSDFKGARIIKIKRNGKRWGPLTFRGEAGGKDTIGAIFGGGVEKNVGGGSGASKEAGMGLTSLATGILSNPTNKIFNKTGLGLGPAGMGVNAFNAITKGKFAVGTGGAFGSVLKNPVAVKTGMKAGAKRIPVVGAVISAGFAVHDGKKRADKVSAALASGDASGISRPLRTPVWYDEASWKNKHVGEKGIAGKIKYSYEEVINPVAQKDSTAITPTSSWWDQVQERTDYPKHEVTQDGKEISYVGTEESAHKTQINFSTEDSMAGQSMLMRAYSDFDANQYNYNQEAIQFNSNSGSGQQDIFVSKRLPCPKTLFGTVSGADGHLNNLSGNKWELSFDMKIANSWTPYVTEYHGLSVARNTLKRTISITFSNRKPDKNDSLMDYVLKHTDGAGDWSTGDKLAGIFFMPDMDFSNKVPKKMYINPFSTYKWNASSGAVENQKLIVAGGNGNFGNDFVHQTSDTNGSYGTQVPIGQWVRYKFSCTPLGASGVMASAAGSGDVEASNKSRHQGRFWLTLHDVENDEVIRCSDEDDYGYGTTRKGPLNLTALSDPAVAHDGLMSRFNYAANLGKNDGIDLIDSKTQGHAKWTPYVTVWVANHRYATGASASPIELRKGSDSTSANNPYKHDVFTKGGLSSSGTNWGSDAHRGPAFLSDMKLYMDQCALKGVEPDVINMSVNSQNLSSGTENMFHKQRTPMPNYYDTALSSPYDGAYFWRKGQDDTQSLVYDEDEQDKIRTLNQMPTMLSIGFTNQAASAFFDDQVGGNTGTCSLTKPSFLLFNDFISEKELPTQIDDKFLNTMYTKFNGSSANNNQYLRDHYRLAGDPIDLFAVLGSSTAKNPFHSGSTTESYLTTGNTAENNIVTGNAETDAWDRNQGSSYKCYVNNFQSKGFMQFQKDLIGTAVNVAGDSWMRRENIYASTHVNKVDRQTITPGYAEFTIAQPDVLRYADNMPNDSTGTELFVIYQYGRPLHFGDPSDYLAGGNGTQNCNAAVGTIEVEENKVKFNRVQSHPSQVATSGEAWEGTYRWSDPNAYSGHGTGGSLVDILKETNMHRVMICPYRKWIIMQIGKNPQGNSATDIETLENYEARGYGSIAAVKRPEAAGTAATGGFALGTTFNESKYYVNSSDQGPYYNRRSFDISEDGVPYEKETDFGLGAYDAELGAGGMVTNHRPDYGFNKVNLDAIADATDYATRFGDMMSFTMVANGAAGEANALYMYSSNITNALGGETYFKPRLITKFKDDPPARPGLVVNPKEDEVSVTQFGLALDGDDLWYGSLMVSDTPIMNKYDKLVAYAPLNEDLDRWMKHTADTRTLTVTPKQIKCYNHIQYEGDEDFTTTGLSDELPNGTMQQRIRGKFSYATATGVFNSTAVTAFSQDTIEGLAGHAKTGAIHFPLGLWGASSNTTYCKHFTAQGIFTFNSAKTTNNYAMMGQLSWDADTSTYNGGAWTVYYDGTNKNIVARCYEQGSSNYVELKSTTAPLLDDETPYHVAIVLDTEILHSNFRLYINGTLEDQTGKALTTGTVNNWKYGATLKQSGYGLGCGKANTLGVTQINWTGKLEEIIVQETPIIFFTPETEEIDYTKYLEEVSANSTGEPKVWNARAFAFDYHNFRPPFIPASKNINWKKTSFNIDGT